MQKQPTDSEKLDAILHKLDNISDKVDEQNQEIADLQRQMRLLQADVAEIAKKSRYQALIAGGIGGAIASVGMELLRVKFGG